MPWIWGITKLRPANLWYWFSHPQICNGCSCSWVWRVRWCFRLGMLDACLYILHLFTWVYNFNPLLSPNQCLARLLLSYSRKLRIWLPSVLQTWDSMRVRSTIALAFLNFPCSRFVWVLRVILSFFLVWKLWIGQPPQLNVIAVYKPWTDSGSVSLNSLSQGFIKSNIGDNPMTDKSVIPGSFKLGDVGVSEAISRTLKGIWGRSKPMLTFTARRGLLHAILSLGSIRPFPVVRVSDISSRGPISEDDVNTKQDEYET